MKVTDLFEFVNDYNLYHVMGHLKSIDVFKKDILPAKWLSVIGSDGEGKMGNSLTRNKTFWFKDEKVVRLTLDSRKLRSRFKLIPADAEYVFRRTHSPHSKPLHDRTFNKNERQMREEFLVGDVRELHRYVTKVEVRFTRAHHWASTSKLVEFLKAVREWCEDHTIELVVDPKLPEYIKKEQKREREEE